MQGKSSKREYNFQIVSCGCIFIVNQQTHNTNMTTVKFLHLDMIKEVSLFIYNCGHVKTRIQAIQHTYISLPSTFNTFEAITSPGFYIYIIAALTSHKAGITKKFGRIENRNGYFYTVIALKYLKTAKNYFPLHFHKHQLQHTISCLLI